jgi:RNA polymerase sigma-70 factor (sigma-E family)
VADSFEQFVRARTPQLLRTAYLLTGDQHSAEDLVQAALERAAAAWWRVRRQASAEAYVRQVMYRLQVSRWRSRRVRERLDADPPERAGQEPYSAVDLRLSLQQALSRLTPHQRAVLVLRFYDDMSVEQAAEVLGCSTGTVKSQTHLALRRLRETAPELAALVEEEAPDYGHDTPR